MSCFFTWCFSVACLTFGLQLGSDRCLNKTGGGHLNVAKVKLQRWWCWKFGDSLVPQKNKVSPSFAIPTWFAETSCLMLWAQQQAHSKAASHVRKGSEGRKMQSDLVCRTRRSWQNKPVDVTLNAKGPIKSYKLHYAPRRGPAYRHWLKQLPGHFDIVQNDRNLGEAGSHASDAVLIGTTGPSHREAWIRLRITELWWDFVLKNPSTCNLQNSLSSLSPTIANFYNSGPLVYKLTTRQHSWIEWFPPDLVSSSASFSSNPLSSNSRSSKSSCVGTSTCASFKKIPEIDFQDLFFGYQNPKKKKTWV